MPKQVQPGEQIILKDNKDNAIAFIVPKQSKVLTGHNDINTAFVVHDYPFGRRLRCPVAYWTEHAIQGAKTGHTRMARATPLKRWCAAYTDYLNNPQLGYATGLAAARRYFENQCSSGKIHWNKTKFSTYSHLLCMELTTVTDSNDEPQLTPDGAVKCSPSRLGLDMYDTVISWLRVTLQIGDQLIDNSTNDAQRIRTVLYAVRTQFECSEYYQSILHSLDSQFLLERGILYRRGK